MCFKVVARIGYTEWHSAKSMFSGQKYGPNSAVRALSLIYSVIS